MSPTTAALIFTIFTSIVILFQGLLAGGMPWGKASMGGKFPGKYPPKMRLAAVANMAVLFFIIVIVLSRAETAFPHLHQFSRIAIWFVVAFFAAGTVMNAITPSKIERIWAPVAFIQLFCAFITAIG